MTWRAALVALAVAGSAMPATAQDKNGVVVMPLESTVLEESALNAMNDLVVFSMSQLSGFRVVTKNDLDAELGRESMKDLMGCDSVKCAAEIGGALGARYLLAGSVRKLGKNVMVNLSLIDTEKRETKRGQAMIEDDENLYPQAVDQAVRQVLGMAVSSAGAPPTPPPAPPATRSVPPLESPNLAGLEWVYSRPAGVEFTRTEVTVAQYRACMTAGPCTPDGLAQSLPCNWDKTEASTIEGNRIFCQAAFSENKPSCAKYALGRARLTAGVWLRAQSDRRPS